MAEEAKLAARKITVWSLVPFAACALLGFWWDSTFLAFFGGLGAGAFFAVKAFQRWGDPRSMHWYSKGTPHG